MQINKKLLPLKVHYFFFLGCKSPILPFLLVVGLQLGMPVQVSSGLTCATLLAIVLLKPLVAGFADSFPSLRRPLFLLALSLSFLSFSSIYFFPPMREDLRVEGSLVTQREGEEGATLGWKPRLLAEMDGNCHIDVAWDCVVECSQPPSCLTTSIATNDTTYNTTSTSTILHTLFPQPVKITQMKVTNHTQNVGGEWDGDLKAYGVEHTLLPHHTTITNVMVMCDGGRWKGAGCPSSWHYWYFWLYSLIMLIGLLNFAITISFTDAIIVDVIGKEGDYGIQRAWGTVGWGLMGPISGLLVDLWSGTSITKNYAPAFLICFTFGLCDLFVSAVFIKVPQIITEKNLLKKVWPILRQPRFFIFCIFIIFNGCFDSLAASFIFLMQEDMARGTNMMNYMKFLQGMTLFVQCGIEAPFMFINMWFMRRLGAQYVTSLVFFLYIFRLVGLGLAGFYLPVWTTLVVEVLNGPCYGLGFTAIVVYSAEISPPGTSTTLQSITNICYESIGYALSMFVGGHIYAAVGGPWMYLGAGLTATLIFFLHLIFLYFFPSSVKENNEEQHPAAGAVEEAEKIILKEEQPGKKDGENDKEHREKEEEEEHREREGEEEEEHRERLLKQKDISDGVM